MASVRSSTADEVMKMMNKTPLFMTSLEDADKDGEENIELQAIRALQYDGTPLENAQNFKDQGNDMVKSKLWTDGKEFYTKAIAILEKSRQTRHHENETHVHASEAAKETDLEAICHVNRALCNLELSMLQSCTAQSELTRQQRITDLRPWTALKCYDMIQRILKLSTGPVLHSLPWTRLQRLPMSVPED